MNRRLDKPLPDRRRFLAIAGAALGAGLLPHGSRAGIRPTTWRGVALGAAAEIRLQHPDRARAAELLAAARSEIERLEKIFSLYRADSALFRLNRDGGLEAPPPELIELLALSRRIHRASRGGFDPTVQPLWRLHAEWFADRPDHADGPPATRIDAALARTGFDRVLFDPRAVTFAQAGMALTLNGIAQGFITDRVCALLRAGGIGDLLVDLGEVRAMGSDRTGPEGWTVRLDPDRSAGAGAPGLRLRDRAVASSARLGTSFDQAGRLGHILDPRTGRPTASATAGASVVAASAALADGLSTAALVCERSDFTVALAGFAGTRARLVTGDGRAGWIGG